MMATVPHVTSVLGLRKFQADGFLLTRVYKNILPTQLDVSIQCSIKFSSYISLHIFSFQQLLASMITLSFYIP